MPSKKPSDEKEQENKKKLADIVVVTPPSFDYGDTSPWSMAEIRGSRSRSECNPPSSIEESEDEILADSAFQDSKTPGDSKKSATMPTSRSCGSIAPRSPNFNKGFLRLPSLKSRSLSAEYSKSDMPSVRQPPSGPRRGKRSRTPQPGSKSLQRRRSPSPLTLRPVGKTSSLGDAPSESAKAPWSRTVRFLSRKSTSAPNSAKVQGEFAWAALHSAGSTSEGNDTADMIITAGGPTATDTSHQDSNNGIEAPITPVHFMPLGSQSGSTSSANGMPADATDGPLPAYDAQREHLRQKIMKISEQVKNEQFQQNENVTEYLKLSSNADSNNKQQVARIRSVFEKKNQKSKATIAQLQKKLDGYHKRLREIDVSGSKTLGGKYGLKEVGAKLTDFSGGVVDTVKQGASKLISKKFGSVDNITALKEEYAGSEDLERCNSVASVEKCNSAATSESGEIAELHQSSPNLTSRPAQAHPLTPDVTEIKTQFASFEKRLSRVEELESQQDRIRTEIEQLTNQIKRDIGILTSNVEEGSYRWQRIEDNLHDLSEMHHREMGDIKQDLASLEEKLEYHAQERARDIQEALESCQTRISKMEVQQQHQHQQLVTMEGVENATARALAGKLINLLLSVLAVILVFVSTVSSIVMPFIRSQTRVLITGLCVVLIAVLYRNWEPWSTYLSDSWWGR